MEYSTVGQSTNALQRVVFIVQFTREFSERDLDRLDTHSTSWRDELPRRSVTNAVLLQPGSNRVAFDDERIAGLSYEALMKDSSVEFGLRFDENRILFLVGRYTRWAEIWPLAQRYLKTAMGLLPEDNPVISFATEYTDLFRAAGEYTEFDASGILRPDSLYIPSHVFDRTENFHTGFLRHTALHSDTGY